MTHSLRVLLSMVLITCVMSACAQAPFTGTKSAKAHKRQQEAETYYSAGENQKALDLVNDAIKLDPAYVDALMLKGSVCNALRLYEDAYQSVKSAIGIAPTLAPAYYFGGLFAMRSLHFEDAAAWYEKYLTFPGLSNQKKTNAERQLKNARFATFAIKNPLPYKLENLGDAINTPFNESGPCLLADGKVIYFSRLKGDENIFFSFLSDAGWSNAIEAPTPLNSELNEGGLSVTVDGQYLFFTACDRHNGLGSCDIWVSKNDGSHWGQPLNLGPVVNSVAWESQPSISSDGKTLYFAANRPGGQGGKDIWKSVFANGKWNAPVNMGPGINTPYDEESPFIHPDGVTLYFSSNGWPGFGGADLYAKKLDDSLPPKNMGYPLNTPDDQVGMVITADGASGYTFNDQPGGKGGMDIYRFDVPQEVRPGRVTYVKGKTLDANTKEVVPAKVELTNLITGQVTTVYSTVIGGNFLVCLPPNASFALNVQATGYLFYSNHFETSLNDVTQPQEIKVELQKVSIGQVLTLKNVFYETNAYQLKPTSYTELDKVVDLLKSNSKIKLEISGHTDNTGDPQKNKVLSQNRADGVKQYLISKGIDATRLTSVGYGDTKPVGPNDSDAGRAQNRRTEIKITGL